MSDSRVVRVELGARGYDIRIGSGLLAEAGTNLVPLAKGRPMVVVTDETVARLHLSTLARSLDGAGVKHRAVILPPGESTKDFAHFARLCEEVLGLGIERQTLIVALGGGVVGDIAGFAAASLLRGLAYVQMPTTLLAQVDSSVGGKTAINAAHGKNLVGAFHQPALVLADVATLATLPRRELLAGLAEVVKYGVIGDAGLFARIEADPTALVTVDPTALVPVVAACARQKAAVVAADEREERGERAVLNFGHTIGHALEAVTGYGRFLHGEAVAVGMVAAARVSHALGVCDAATVDRIRALLGRLGLPIALPADVETSALGAAMRADKKSAGGRIRFIAVEDIGRTRFVSLTAQDIVERL